MRTLCLSFACVALLSSATRALAAEAYPEPLPIGAPAPDFSLPGVDGKDHTLAEYADAKVLVLVFTCNHCPTAQAYEERIQGLARDYRAKGVAVLAISPNDPLALRLDELGYTDVGDKLEDMKIRAEEKGFDFPYLYDGETQSVSRAYGPVSTPHVFIFDAERKLRFRGRIDNGEQAEKATEHDTRNAIEALLSGKPVPVETTKTMGCSTKWSGKRPTVAEAAEKWAQQEVTVALAGVEEIKGLVANDTENLRLINVWQTTCGPCVVEFPELVIMRQMYQTRPFELVTISTDPVAKKDQVHAFLKKNQAAMSNYHFSGDDPYKIIEAIDPQWEGGLPYTLLVAPKGEILYRHMGGIDPLEVRRAIVAYLGRVYR
ncbi:MAG: redoxin domain-containing protein [Candidatus Hydrogenedentes bacterium]|nr:redoxin domain-containing protein [Candidatus Hydrogenedentota bacterium]